MTSPTCDGDGYVVTVTNASQPDTAPTFISMISI